MSAYVLVDIKVHDPVKFVIKKDRLTLVDADGKIRRYYDSTDEQDMTALKQDAAALADEAATAR